MNTGAAPLLLALQFPFEFIWGEYHGPDALLHDIQHSFGDGVLISLALLVGLCAHLRRALRDSPRWIPWALAGITLVAFLLRLWVPRETIMNAWPYERFVPLARHMAEGFVLPAFGRVARIPLYVTDVIFRTDLFIATFTPLVLFAHARFVLKDDYSALAAAAIMAVLPNHIRFSRADTEIIQSICSSSVTFVVLYSALRETDPRWRSWAYALVFPLSLMTYWVRPENMVFYVLDLGAIVLTAGPMVSRKRRLLALGEVTLAAAIAIVFRIIPGYSHPVREGLSLRTVQNFFEMGIDPAMNTLINPHATPPGLVVMVAVGAVVLWRRGDRGRTLFLFAWILGLFMVHSYVRPTEPMMQARYHLNITTPFVLLAAASTPALLRLPRFVPWLLAAYLAASPLIHLRFIRDTDFNEMREFDFLRAQRGRIPPRCTVLEFAPEFGLDRVGYTFGLRLRRIGEREHSDGMISPQWNVVNSGRLAAPSTDPEAHETLSPEAERILAAPPDCLYVYEGLSCQSHRPASTPIAPVCAALRERLDLRPVAATTFPSRMYDEVNAGRVVTAPNGNTMCLTLLRPGEPIRLTLYRATPRAAARP
ncbi:MAG: hypothetical protein Q8S73_10015 [Deltaproteobacteria bacterium]|nr:hypothetical protein [Deltaproteobacteria bacterium]